MTGHTAPTPAPAPVGGAGPRHIVRGLDLSLTGTGIAGAGWATTIGSTGRRADPLPARRGRLRRLADAILDTLGVPELVVVEGPAYSRRGGSAWDRAGLWWLVVDTLCAREIPVAVATPKARARYATGRGNADKPAVLAAVVDRYGLVVDDDNQADAYTLCAMGHDWLGDPLVVVPDEHRAALDAVEWPDLLTVDGSRP